MIRINKYDDNDNYTRGHSLFYYRRYFIIGGIVLGIVVNIMTMIDGDLKDDQDYNINNIDNIGIIGILWPISVPLLIGLAIIAIIGALINIIAGLFIKNKKR